jgi:hypothetical protein
MERLTVVIGLVDPFYFNQHYVGKLSFVYGRKYSKFLRFALYILTGNSE